MANLDKDGNPIEFGLTEKQKRYCECLRALRFVYGDSAVGIGVQAAQAAGYQGNPDAIKVEASRLKSNPKVRAYLASLDEASGALCDYPILSDEEMKRIASKEAQTAKSDASRVRALEVLAKLKEGDGDRLEQTSTEELLLGLAGGNSEVEAILRDHFGVPKPDESSR